MSELGSGTSTGSGTSSGTNPLNETTSASSFSTNLGLEEQTPDQFYDINVVNGNLEIMDQAFGRNNIVLTATSVNTLPWVITNPKIKPGHRVVNMVLSNPAAQLSDWSYAVADGSFTLSGTISGTTHIYIYLAEVYGLNAVSGVKINAWASVSESNGYKNLGTIESVNDIKTALDNEVSTMVNHSIRNIYFTYNNGNDSVTSDSVFYNSTIYHGAIIRNTSATGVRVYFYQTNAMDYISGYRTSNGWFFSLFGNHIKLVAADTSWPRIWEKLSALYNGDTLAIYISPAAIALISSNGRTGEIMSGTVSRYSSGEFHFFLKSASGVVVSAKITGASSSGPGTYTETLYVAKTEPVDSGSNTITFTVPLHKYMVLFYAGHMTSIFNANTANTKVWFGGDNPSDTEIGFSLTKAANSNVYTLTRTNGSTFYWATMIL